MEHTLVPSKSARPSSSQTARAVLSLFKLRIGTLVMITALVGMVITPGASLHLLQVVVLLVRVMQLPLVLSRKVLAKVH